MLNITNEELLTIQELKPHFKGWKKNHTMNIPRDLDNRFQAVYQRIYGVSVPRCSSGQCYAKAMYTLLVESEVGVD